MRPSQISLSTSRMRQFIARFASVGQAAKVYGSDSSLSCLTEVKDAPRRDFPCRTSSATPCIPVLPNPNGRIDRFSTSPLCHEFFSPDSPVGFPGLVSVSCVRALLGVAAVLVGGADEFGDPWVDLDLGNLVSPLSL